MATLTEFSNIALKKGLEIKSSFKQDEWLQKITESLHLEEQKLPLFLHALEIAAQKPQDLKRIVVFSLKENQVPPKNAILKDQYYFLVEYFPALKSTLAPAKKDFKKGRTKQPTKTQKSASYGATIIIKTSKKPNQK